MQIMNFKLFTPIGYVTVLSCISIKNHDPTFNMRQEYLTSSGSPLLIKFYDKATYILVEGIYKLRAIVGMPGH